jgi:hypothetical protein
MGKLLKIKHALSKASEAGLIKSFLRFFLAIFLFFGCLFLYLNFYTESNVHALTLNSNTTYSTNQNITSGLTVTNNSILNIDPGVVVTVTGGAVIVESGSTINLGEGATLSASLGINIRGVFNAGAGSIITVPGAADININPNSNGLPIAQLNLSEGSKVRMSAGRRVMVGVNTERRGVIRSIGTESNNVIFESVSGTSPASWRGVSLNNIQNYNSNDQTGTLFLNTTFRYGGSSATEGVLHFNNGSVAKVENSYFFNNRTGVSSSTSSTQGELILHSNTFENTQTGFAPISYSISQKLDFFDTTILGTGYKAIMIHGSIHQLTANLELLYYYDGNYIQQIPYTNSGTVHITNGATVNIGQGTVIKSTANLFNVLTGGKLNVNGISVQPVIFTSLFDDTTLGDTDNASNTPIAQQWYIYSSVPSQGIANINNAEFRFFGEVNSYNTGGIRLANSNSSCRNCRFNNGTTAIDIAGPISPTIENVIFENLSHSPISMNFNSNPIFSGTVTFTNSNKFIQISSTTGVPPAPGSQMNLSRIFWQDSTEVQYLLTNTVQLGSGNTLNIQPGTVVKFLSSGLLSMTGGSLIIPQDNEEPSLRTVFTSYRDSSVLYDIWRTNQGAPTNSDSGVMLNANTTTPNIQITNLDVKYGGSNTQGALIISGSTTLNNINFDNNMVALSTVADIGNPTFSNLNFSNSGQFNAPIIMDIKMSPNFLGTFTFNNSNKFIGIQGNVNTSNAVIRNLNWPGSTDKIQYFLASNINIQTNRVLDIEAGSIIKFGAFSCASSRNINTSGNGIINVLGTESEPVHFTSIDNDSIGGQIYFTPVLTGTSAWCNVLSSNGQPNSTINISNAVFTGIGTATLGETLVIFGGTGSINNTQFVNTTSGIGVRSTASNVNIQRIDWQNVDIKIYYDIASTNIQFTGPFSKTGTGTDGYFVSGVLTGTRTLSNFQFSDGTPFIPILDGITIPSGTTLNVTQGTVIKAMRNILGSKRGFSVEGGTLNFNGTQLEKIYYTALEDDSVSGDTQNNGSTAITNSSGITVFANSAVNLTHSVIKFASADTGTTNSWPTFHRRGAIDLRNGTSAVSLNDVVFTNNSRSIVAENNSVPNILFNNVDIKNHLGNCTNIFSLHNENLGNIITAQHIFWGDASGPLDNSDDRGTGGLYNPAGLGACVSDRVIYAPWATGALNLPSPPSIVRDGTTLTDIDYTNSNNTLSANWNSVSGVTGYEYAIGTSPNGNQLVDWTDNGNLNSFTRTDLSLITGTTYYISVRSYNDLGTSTPSSSDGILVDFVNPSNPSNSLQFLIDGVTPVQEGQFTGSNSVNFKANIIDTGGSNTIYWDIELRLQSQSFNGVATHTQTYTNYVPGTTINASRNISGLNSGSEYKWRSRVRDIAGNTSNWVNFGLNDGLFDFKVSEPTQFIVVMPGQTFTNGVGVSGTPTPFQAGAIGQEARIYAVNENLQRVFYYSANINISSDDNTARFNGSAIPGSVNVNMTSGLAIFTVRFDTINLYPGWRIQVSQNSGATSLPSTQSDFIIVNPGAVDPDNSFIEIAQNPIEASSTSFTQLTITLRDSANNPVSGKNINISVISGSSIVIFQANNPTNSNGQTTAGIRSTVSGIKRIRATNTTDNIVINNELEFTVVSSNIVSQTNSSLQVSPEFIKANNADEATITLSLRDQFNNPIINREATIQSTGSNISLNQIQSVTNSSGIINASIRSPDIQSITIYAIIDPNGESFQLTDSAQLNFIAGDPDPETSEILLSETNKLADGVEELEVVVLVNDSQFRPVSGMQISISVSGSNNTITVFRETTNEFGTAIFLLSSTRAEVKTITARNITFNQDINDSRDVTFFAGPMSNSNSTLSVVPSTIGANGIDTSTVTVVLRDQFNNPIQGKNITIISTGNDNITQPSSPTTSGGVATATITSLEAGSKTISAINSTDDILLSQTQTLNVQSIIFSQENSTIEIVPNQLIANGTDEATITITLRDNGNNPIQGKNITISSTGSNNTITQPQSPTDSNGQTTATIRSTRAEVKTITAFSVEDNLNLNNQATVTFISGPISNSNSFISALPLVLVADGNQTSTITVTLRDQFNNPIQGRNITISSTGSNNTITQPTAVTNSYGSTNASISSTKSEEKIITAYVVEDELTLNSTINITFTGGDVDQNLSSISSDPIQRIADGVEESIITITLIDQFNNPISGKVVSVSSSGTNNFISQPQSPTDSNGQTTATIRSTRAEVKTITASIPADSFVLSQNAQVTFIAGSVDPQTSLVSANPNTIVANNVDNIEITVTLRDQFLNPVSGRTVEILVEGTPENSAGITITQPVLPTNSNGQTIGYVRSSIIGPAEVSAIVTPENIEIDQTQGINFTGSGVVDPDNSTIHASPTSLTANGTSTSTITITLLDEFNNPVSGKNVQVFASGNNNTIVQPQNPTDSNGQTTATIRSTRAEVKTITAINTTDDQLLSDDAEVTFIAGAISVANSSITPSPNTVQANGTDFTTISVLLRDEYLNPISGKSVTLFTTGSNNTVSQPSTQTNSSGITTGTIRSTRAEIKEITAFIPSDNVIITPPAQVNFVSGAATDSNSTITVNKNQAIADNDDFIEITVRLLDINLNPVINQEILVNVTGSDNTFSNSNTGYTDENGEFKTNLTSSLAENKVITATNITANQQIVGQQNITFIPGSPSNSQTTIETNKDIAIANNTDQINVTATLRDGFGNAIPNAYIRIIPSGSGNTVQQSIFNTNPSGVVQATIVSNNPELKIISLENDLNQPVTNVSREITFAPVPTPSPTSTPTPTPTQSPTPTSTPSPSPTQLPTTTSTPSQTPLPTSQPTITQTPRPNPTQGISPTPTQSPITTTEPTPNNVTEFIENIVLNITETVQVAYENIVEVLESIPEFINEEVGFVGFTSTIVVGLTLLITALPYLQYLLLSGFILQFLRSLFIATNTNYSALVDKSNGNIISYAAIQIKALGDGTVYKTVSDARGRFKIKIPQGEYFITISHYEYSQEVYKVTMDKPDYIKLKFELEKITEKDIATYIQLKVFQIEPRILIFVLGLMGTVLNAILITTVWSIGLIALTGILGFILVKNPNIWKRYKF